MISITTTIESIISEENILKSIMYLQKAKCINDQSGLNPSNLMEYWNSNKRSIINSIYEENYELFPVKQYEKLSKAGKKRTISIIAMADRLIARAIQQLLSEEVDSQISLKCFL